MGLKWQTFLLLPLTSRKSLAQLESESGEASSPNTPRNTSVPVSVGASQLVVLTPFHTCGPLFIQTNGMDDPWDTTVRNLSRKHVWSLYLCGWLPYACSMISFPSLPLLSLASARVDEVRADMVGCNDAGSPPNTLLRLLNYE
jgi:hypothetical protein